MFWRARESRVFVQSGDAQRTIGNIATTLFPAFLRARSINQISKDRHDHLACSGVGVSFNKGFYKTSVERAISVDLDRLTREERFCTSAIHVSPLEENWSR